MRIPKSLEQLADDGVIDEVLRPLMSGKEAQIYLVVAGGKYCAAKIYKDAQTRSFKNRADYVEGRSVRNTRDQRAMNKGSKYGKSQDEEAWKSTEVDMIYRMFAAGVRVPAPIIYMDGVLVMELVCDDQGNPAPRLGDLEFSPQEATRIYNHLITEVIRMLCADIVHGDLSEFNVLLGESGPVVIDFPQSVSAAGNRNARTLLIRDVDNLHRFLARWVPGSRRRPYAEEMWALYENNELTPDTQLTGRFQTSRGPVDTRAVLELIGDANRDEARRRQATGQPTLGLAPESNQPVARRREVIVEKPAPRRREFVVEKPAARNVPRPNNERGTQGSGRGPHAQGTHRPGGFGSRAPGERPEQRRFDPRGPHAKPKTGPKRGDQVQASTYVSPEARKIKVKPLTPRNATSPSQKVNEGAQTRPANERQAHSRRDRPRREPRTSNATQKDPSTQLRPRTPHITQNGDATNGGAPEKSRRRRRPRRPREGGPPRPPEPGKV